MNQLKTDPKLLDALKRAARQTLTADEIEKQRVSFVMGSLSEKNTVTRSQVTKILAVHEGRTGT
jgi:hypothetical protein